MSTETEVPAAGSGAATALALVAGLFATAFSLLFQSPGVVLSPDGWAYWEGSVSLLRGEGLRYFGGQPLGAWPPAFPTYLALWQGLLGVSAGTLAVAEATALGVAVALWVAAANTLAGQRRPDLRRVCVAVVFAIALPLALRSVLSESLFIALIGGATLVAVRRPELGRSAARMSSGDVARAAWFFLLLSLVVLTRHLGIALLPALGYLLWRSSGRGSGGRRSFAIAVAASIGGAAVWILCRIVLGQLGSHHPIPFAREEMLRTSEGLVANLVALWTLVAPASLRGAALAVATVCVATVALQRFAWLDAPEPGGRLPRERVDSGLGIAALLSIAGTLGALALYGLWGARFVLPSAALLLLVLFQRSEQAAGVRARRLATAALLTLALVQVARGGYWVRYSLSVAPQGVGWGKKIVPACAPGDAKCSLAPDEVSPPDFPWIDRGIARRARQGTATP